MRLKEDRRSWQLHPDCIMQESRYKMRPELYTPNRKRRVALLRCTSCRRVSLAVQSPLLHQKNMARRHLSWRTAPMDFRSEDRTISRMDKRCFRVDMPWSYYLVSPPIIGKLTKP